MMRCMKGSSRAAGGRASPEAVEKRRAARQFNDVLLGGGRASKLDGRTEKRRRRLLEELSKGTARTGGRELKPIDVLLRVQALLELEEPIASIKKVCKAPRPVQASDSVIEGVRALHKAYGFFPEAYAFVGIDEATLKRAGVIRRAHRDGDLARTRPPAQAPTRERRSGKTAA